MKILNIIKTLTLIDLFQGLIVTLKNFFRRKVTVQYPEVKTPISNRFRGKLALMKYENGEERCIACKLCSAVCPANAISIDSEESEDGTRRTTRFDIDAFKCVYCGFCEEACPVDAIVETDIFEYHMTKNHQRLQTKEMLLKLGEDYREKILSKKEKDYLYK